MFNQCSAAVVTSQWPWRATGYAGFCCSPPLTHQLEHDNQLIIKTLRGFRAGLEQNHARPVALQTMVGDHSCSKYQVKDKIKCIYQAVFTSSDVIKRLYRTQPKTQKGKQCRCRSTVARKNSLERLEPRKKPRE